MNKKAITYLILFALSISILTYFLLGIKLMFAALGFLITAFFAYKFIDNLD